MVDFRTMPPEEYDLPDLVFCIDDVAKAVADEFGEKGVGGYLSLFAPEGYLLIELRVANPEIGKSSKYREGSIEQVVRLWKHPRHLSSYQSRDPSYNRGSGAIRLQNGCFLSFAGWPDDLIDQAFTAALAVGMKWEDPEYINQIMKISGNRGNYDRICKCTSYIWG